MSEQHHELYEVETFAPLLEEVRRRLADKMGVTVVGHHLTLRLDVGGKHTTVKLLVSGISQYVPCCDSCGDPFVHGHRRYPVKQQIKHDGRQVSEAALEICGECAK